MAVQETLFGCEPQLFLMSKGARAVAKEALQGGCNGLNLPTKGVVIGCGQK